MKQIITDKEIDSWQLSADGPRLYSTDTVIDAYLKGKKDGLDEQQKAIQNIFAGNYRKSSQNTSELYKFLTSIDIIPVSAHLKFNSFVSFEVIVLLTEDDFLSNKMDKVYTWCREFQNRVEEDSYRVCFSFIDFLEGFDFTQLISDGFNARYNPK